MKLENKVTVIIGGSGGIGKVITRAFLEEGSRVVIAGRTLEALESTVKDMGYFKGNISYVQADILNRKDVENIFQQTISKYGNLDVLINIAAVQAPIGPFADLDFEDCVRNININLIGTISCCKSALTPMIKNKKGKIINFSGGGAFYPRPNFLMYGCTKTAVVRFSETLAYELKDSGIDVNVIAPGAINTRMCQEIIDKGYLSGESEVKKALEVQKNMGTSPLLPAKLAVFLASEESNGITGKVISAVWDDWKNISKNKLEDSKYTLRRIDGRNFMEYKND